MEEGGGGGGVEKSGGDGEQRLGSLNYAGC